MSYPNGTILRRNDPFTDKDKLHLNHVIVKGKSPAQQPSLAEWGGASGDSVVIEPVDEFGPPESLPIEVGNAEYTVEFMPDPEPLTTTTEQVTRSAQRLVAETPEQVFKREQREAAASLPASPPVVDAAAEPEVVVTPAVAKKAAPKRAAK